MPSGFGKGRGSGHKNRADKSGPQTFMVRWGHGGHIVLQAYFLVKYVVYRNSTNKPNVLVVHIKMHQSGTEKF